MIAFFVAVNVLLVICCFESFLGNKTNKSMSLSPFSPVSRADDPMNITRAFFPSWFCSFLAIFTACSRSSFASFGVGLIFSEVFSKIFSILFFAAIFLPLIVFLEGRGFKRWGGGVVFKVVVGLNFFHGFHYSWVSFFVLRG